MQLELVELQHQTLEKETLMSPHYRVEQGMRRNLRTHSVVAEAAKAESALVVLQILKPR